MEHLKYPVGQFVYPEQVSQNEMKNYIEEIKSLPQKLSSLIKHCELNDLEKTYRPEGWIVAQVINHLVDSHLNAFLRLKFALLEDNFEAKLYNENDWVKTPENSTLNALSSAEFLKHLHFRWSELLSSLTDAQLNRTFFNPYSKRTLTLKQHSALYAWHCQHHLAHIKLALVK